MSFSNKVTPETFIKKNPMTAGETIVHSGAPQETLNIHSPHHTAKSPK